MATKNWAEETSDDEKDSDVEELEDISNIYNAPYLAEILLSNESVERGELGRYFESLGCKILRLDIDHKKAFFEFEDASSLHKCLKEDKKQILKGLSITAKVLVYVEKSANNRSHSNRYRGERERSDNRTDKVASKVNGNNREKGKPNRSENSQSISIPEVRPKIVIQPRTLPLETIGLPVRKPDIFGGGKPHDETEYEVMSFIHIYYLTLMEGTKAEAVERVLSVRGASSSSSNGDSAD